MPHGIRSSFGAGGVATGILLSLMNLSLSIASCSYGPPIVILARSCLFPCLSESRLRLLRVMLWSAEDAGGETLEFLFSLIDKPYNGLTIASCLPGLCGACLKKSLIRIIPAAWSDPAFFSKASLRPLVRETRLVSVAKRRRFLRGGCAGRRVGAGRGVGASSDRYRYTHHNKIKSSR